MNHNKIKIGFFGTPEYAVMALDALKNANIEIAFIVTVPDKPSGRKMIVTPSPTKVWAKSNNIPVLQPDKLINDDFIDQLKSYNCDVFIVLAYGKIIPDVILNIPTHKSLNIHPSLLPKLRGSCPIETAILNDIKNTGVTIIRMDDAMDHGPIIAQKEVLVEPWPPKAKTLGIELVKAGSDLIISILPKWINNEIKETEQNHDIASYTKKIEKEDGLIDLNGNPYKNYLKIQAYDGWPSAFFFKDNIRMKITEADFINNKLIIKKVIPEGKSEINYQLE